jgi:hypothetical protein
MNFEIFIQHTDRAMYTTPKHSAQNSNHIWRNKKYFKLFLGRIYLCWLSKCILNFELQFLRVVYKYGCVFSIVTRVDDMFWRNGTKTDFSLDISKKHIIGGREVNSHQRFVSQMKKIGTTTVGKDRISTTSMSHTTLVNKDENP